MTEELERREEREEWSDDERASRPLSEEGEIVPAEGGTTVAPRLELTVAVAVVDTVLGDVLDVAEKAAFPVKGEDEGGRRVRGIRGELPARFLCCCESIDEARFAVGVPSRLPGFEELVVVVDGMGGDWVFCLCCSDMAVDVRLRPAGVDLVC